MLFLSLGLGGACGSCLRYLFSGWIAKVFGTNLAFGTLSVNVIGSFVIGIIFILIHDKMYIPQTYKPFLITGLLGSFTTFSSFSLETLNHILDGQYVEAALYVSLSLVLCLLFCYLGMSIARLF